MRKFDVIMKWVESDQKYHMIVKRTGGMIQEAPADLGFDDIHQYNCHFLPWAYKDINKETDEEYEITIRNKKEKQVMAEQAEAGRLTSKYTIEISNDKGINTIEGTVIVRDQSFGDASVQLAATLEALFAPAKAKKQL